MKNSRWSKDGILKFGDFDANYTFKGFSPEQFRKYSNQYAYMVGSHVSEDGNTAIIKISSNHVIPTKYGYAVIVDAKRVVFIKHWQVWGTSFKDGSYIISFNRQYYQVKEWGDHSEDFGEYEDINESSPGNFDNLVKLAKEQEEYYAGVDVDEDGFETRRSFDWKW